MNKNNKWLRFKLELEKFIIYEWWQILIVLSAIIFLAWLFNKEIESIFFCISHITIRACFSKQYHSKLIRICMPITLFVIFVGILSVLPIELSILSSVPLSFMIAYIGYIVQDRLDLIVIIKKLNKYIEELTNKIKNKDIWSMNQDELYEHCRNCGLSEDDCKIAYFVIIERLKGKQL